MNEDDEILESLILGGVVGASLGALVSKNQEEGIVLGALAGAAIVGTFKASQAAKKTNIPLVIEENDALYIVAEDGTKRFLKNIEKSTKKLPKSFKLE